MVHEQSPFFETMFSPHGWLYVHIIKALLAVCINLFCSSPPNTIPLNKHLKAHMEFLMPWPQCRHSPKMLSSTTVSFVIVSNLKSSTWRYPRPSHFHPIPFIAPWSTELHLRELEIDGAQMMFDADGDNEDEIDLMLLQVAERLEGAPGCAQFPNAFRDLHSQVQNQLPSSLYPFNGVF